NEVGYVAEVSPSRRAVGCWDGILGSAEYPGNDAGKIATLIRELSVASGQGDASLVVADNESAVASMRECELAILTSALDVRLGPTWREDAGGDIRATIEGVDVSVRFDAESARWSVGARVTSFQSTI